MSLSVEIKRLYSPDLPDISDEPEDSLDCWIRVYADIGEVGAPGADTFSLVACTVRPSNANWIERRRSGATRCC